MYIYLLRSKQQTYYATAQEVFKAMKRDCDVGDPPESLYLVGSSFCSDIIHAKNWNWRSDEQPMAQFDESYF